MLRQLWLRVLVVRVGVAAAVGCTVAVVGCMAAAASTAARWAAVAADYVGLRWAAAHFAVRKPAVVGSGRRTLAAAGLA